MCAIYALTQIKDIDTTKHNPASDGPPTQLLSFPSGEQKAVLPPPGYGPDWTQGLFERRALAKIHSIFSSTTSLVMIGIFCRAQDIALRTIIRHTSVQLAPAAVTIRFVVCIPLENPPDALLWAEMQQEPDLFLMDCVENMDEGKSIQFFKSVRHEYPGFSFYAKADSDSYILYHNLALALANAPRTMFYGGRSNFGLNSNVVPNMSGSLYILSSDLVKALEMCEQECSDLTGFEDLRTGKILQLLKGESIRLRDFGRNHSILYNHWDPVASPLHPWLVLVHPVKEPTVWWNMHVHFTNIVSADTVQLASKHTFFNRAGT